MINSIIILANVIISASCRYSAPLEKVKVWDKRVIIDSNTNLRYKIYKYVRLTMLNQKLKYKTDL